MTDETPPNTPPSSPESPDYSHGLEDLSLAAPVKLDASAIPCAGSSRVNVAPPVSDEFLRRVISVAGDLGAPPEALLRVMYSESGLRPDIVNPHGGATGLVQFMPGTAVNLGTTVEALAVMTREDQMEYVEKFFKAFHHPALRSTADLYTVMFYNKNFGKPVIASQTSDNATERQAYDWNKVLDVDKDGQITPEDLDAWAHIQSKGAGFDALLQRMAALSSASPASP